MEVMVGSSFGIGMAACVRNRTQDKAVPSVAALFLPDESRRGGSNIGLASQIGLRISKSPVESSEDSSSSIGESSDDDEEEEFNDPVSFHGRGEGGALDSLSSLEDCLPIKRGLSNYYVGKSKSFGNLMEASNINAKDLEKAENPFNKRRRLLIANKLRSRAGRSMSASRFYTWQNPNSMPLLALQEHNEVDFCNDDDDYEENDQTIQLFEKRMIMKKNKRDLMAQTRSCFCLSSLQEEDDDDGGDDYDNEDE